MTVREAVSGQHCVGKVLHGVTLVGARAALERVEVRPEGRIRKVVREALHLHVAP